MPDKIVDGDSYDWSTDGGFRGRSGQTKYLHLLDGNARELDVRDYGHTNPTNFLIAVRRTARQRGLTYRSKVLGRHHAAFQVTGKKPTEES